MSDCMNAEVRDALPDLVHGRLDELNTATMTAHVESCEDCRAELALLKSVRESAPLVPSMNVERIAAAIGNYGGASALSHAPAQHQARRSWSYGLMATLAAAVFVIGSVTLNGRDEQPDLASSVVAVNSAAANSVVASTHTPAVAEPANATTNDVQPLAKFNSGNRVASISLVGGTQDLSDAELETLLADLDTMDGMPAAEPQSIITTIENIDGGE